MNRSSVGMIGVAWRKAATATAVVLLAATLAGCGVRGSLESPDGGGADKTKASADSGQGKKEGAAAKPHREFILDGLIR